MRLHVPQQSASRAQAGQPGLHREKTTWRTLPNLLTVFRIVLIAPFAYLCICGYDLFALAVFLMAAITDALDGALARRFHQKSQFGRLADPLADKLLTTTAFVALSFFRQSRNAIPIWIAIAVVARDVFILLGCLIVYLLIRSLAFRPRVLGKANTFIEAGTIVCFLASSRVLLAGYVMKPLYLLLLASLILSASDYFLQGIRLLRERG
jgi:cardiolipin synthase (CMP-forming)